MRTFMPAQLGYDFISVKTNRSFCVGKISYNKAF